ncbi:hypothetical protein LOTGIDRAFT_192905 [Lottia gigantea]|uniref:CXXC motif containing zinc binding protein n=1 Tax=Lottia gigantea TaxID=225164 RepID=V4A3X5_LOTGI|nr:hypothetical protein LOTGIDRAFT_192905 [Lottia gigantea]ESO89690.1 hypothetical protein LOTGIDRAFT_192905 [Lottia gigantea]
MVKISLQICAQLERVTELEPADTEDFGWCMKLQCMNCNEETPDFVFASLSESTGVTGGRGSASLVIKCKLCKRENSLDIIRDSLGKYNIEDAGKFRTIVTFDCRGVQPTDFKPNDGWKVKGEESNTPFEIDLTELEWYDYDEKASESVSVTEFKHQFK